MLLEDQMLQPTGSNPETSVNPEKNAFPEDPSVNGSDPFSQPTEIKIYVSDHGQKGTLDNEDKVMVQAHNMFGQLISRSSWMTPLKFAETHFNFFQQQQWTHSRPPDQHDQKLDMLSRQGEYTNKEFTEIGDRFHVQVAWFTDATPKEGRFQIHPGLYSLVHSLEMTTYSTMFMKMFSVSRLLKDNKDFFKQTLQPDQTNK